MNRGAVGVGAALGLGLLCSVSSAYAAETTFRLEYEAPSSASCPDRDAFVREILARTQRPRLVGDDDASAITLRALIEVAGETSSSGKLEIREPDGTSETRSVTSRTCEEVAKGLALVAALVLDPDARTEANVEVGPPPAPAQPAPPPVPPEKSPPPAPPPATPRTRWRASTGAEFGFLGGIGPAIAPMGGLLFDVERTSPSGWSASVRSSFDFARTSSDLARGGRQTYEWLGGSLRACPIYFGVIEQLRTAPCAALQIGAHRGTTQLVPNPTASTELWVAPMALGTVELTITREIVLELSGGALFPLRRTRYFLAPDTTIFDVPAVAGTANLALRVRIL